MRSIGFVLVTALCACAAEPEALEEEVDTDGKVDSPDSADNPRTPSGAPAQFPIVLVHGFNASPQKNGFGPDVVRALCADGHAVFAPALPAFASAEVRADALARAVDAILGGASDACGVQPAQAPAKVNLIAHSMGGLDSRAMINRGYIARVASLVTISTPHRGSAVADMALGLTDFLDSDAMAKLSQFIARPLGDQIAPDVEAAMFSLSETNAIAFEQANPYDGGDGRVRVESWAGLSNVAGIVNAQDAGACDNKMALFPNAVTRHRMGVLLKPIAYVVGHRFSLRPNDGLVQVASAKFGTFRGCVPADHADEVGAFPFPRFDHIRFIRNRAFELSSNGL
jgi:triacylglycerol lipase